MRYGFKHGLSKTPEFRAWAKAKARCTCPTDRAYKYYGGRGITFAPEFEDFLVFLAEIGPRPDSSYSLDRIENAKGYEPGNVRWATRSEQMSNRRGMRPVIEFAGEVGNIAFWSRRSGIDHATLTARLDRGWTMDKAISEPVRSRKSRTFGSGQDAA